MSREAFEQAVPFFVETAAQVRPDQWESLALGVWSVRDLVGHTSRAMLTVEQYATVGADRGGFGTTDEIAERGRVAGRALFEAATRGARQRGCRLLLIETQNVNVPACRFYAAQGCTLGAIDRFAYADLPDETQLIWTLPL